MADNNMNINSTPEQELDLDQLEQVSGGGVLVLREKGTKLQPATGGIMPVAGGDSLQATGGVIKPFPSGGAAADNDDRSEGGLSRASGRPLSRVP